MSDHQNQSSVVGGSARAGRDLTVNVYGNVHARAGDNEASTDISSALHAKEPSTSIDNQYRKPRKLLPIEEKLKTINENMWNHVNTSIKVFQTENVTEPKFKVFPQIAVSPNFYKGQHIVEIRPGFTLNSSSREYEDRSSEYEDGSSEYEDRSSQYEDGNSEYEDRSSQYEDGNSEYEDRSSEYEDGSSEYEDGSSEYEDGSSEDEDGSSEDDYNVQTPHVSNANRNEYIKEGIFQFETRSMTKSVSFESVMQEISKRPQTGSSEQLPVFGLFAQAGAGKTTFMRHWAKQIMVKAGMSPENDYLSPAESRFQLLLYYDLKDFQFHDDSKTTTVQELLFGGLVDDTRQLCDWLMENQSKVILFFDGLDQAPWQITEKNATGIRPKQEANIPTIFFNLLSRNVLQNSSIVLSSREFKAAALPYQARPQKVYSLTGFTSKDAKFLFNTLVTPKHESPGEGINNRIEEEHPQNDDDTPYEKFTKTLSFQHFLTIPMFLTFAALVYKSFKGYIPNSVTELLAKVLELLQCSDNIQERKNIWKVISKLKPLAHSGMKKGVVVFTSDDLKTQRLEINDARDLLLMVPAPNILSQHLLEGNSTLFFCHQIIQEFLSACYIIELSVKSFSKFVRKDLHEKRWSVVRRFVCGLLFLNSISGNLVRITDKEDKIKIIRKSLSQQISGTGDSELFASIYESDDDQLIQSIKEIGLRFHGLTCDEAHMISSLMARTKQLEHVIFKRLNDELLNVMAANLENVKLRVETIYLTCSQFSATAFNNFFQNIDSDEIFVDNHYESPNFKQPGRINWKNIRRLLLESHCFITFSNHPNSVEVYIEECDGTEVCSGVFDKKNETLVFYRGLSEHSLTIQCQMEASAWLSSKSISSNIKGLCAQYIYYADLRDMEEVQSHVKVDEIVLDATYMNDGDEETTVRDKITSLVRLFQVQILNIVIELESLCLFPLQLEHNLAAIGCELKIHVFESVGEAADLQKLISTLRENQARYFKLKVGNGIEVEDLISFINSCNVTKQLVINVTLPDIAKQKLKDAAESSRITLTFEELKGHKIAGRRDAWSYVG